MDHKTVEEYILSFQDAWLDHPFGENVAVYKVGPNPDKEGASKMFALINEGKTPIRLSLRCEPVLSAVLREKYEEVLPGQHLNSKQWNTLILSGQLEWEEVKGLIRHSYDLVLSEE
ncbi:MAG TPA: MmcQ/YjbR family DNA-binding protein [Candidatus Saccharimonadales bacterium]|nr:MmcQ/YjbR family DNA-binding protein [Candidatus Saccharimonadales bacterium]